MADSQKQFRPSPAAWEQARADYEVRGCTLTAIASRLGVSIAAVSKKAQKEGWDSTVVEPLLETKLNAIKQLHEVEKEKLKFSPLQQQTFEQAVQQRLTEEEIAASFRYGLYEKGHEILPAVKTPAELKDLTQASKNLAPSVPQTIVNTSAVAGAAAQGGEAAFDLSAATPEQLEALAALLGGVATKPPSE